MPKKEIELDFNQKYGRLTLIVCVDDKSKKGVVWSCRCDCGKKIRVQAYNLASGAIKSCGCKRNEGGVKTHGMRNIPEYKAWENMKQRCYNTRDKRYKNWGGRCIKVCEQWLNSFENFYADLGPKPFPKILYSLDRVNNDGDYTPENCCWATQKQQQNNRRNSKKKD